MRPHLQFVRWLLPLILAAGMAVPAFAAQGRQERAQQRRERAEQRRGNQPDRSPRPRASDSRPAARPRADRPFDRGNSRDRPPAPGPRDFGRPGAANVPGDRSDRPGADFRQSGEGQGLPPRWMERLRDMTPQAQERFLRNNQRFQNLPPQRQDQIRRRLGQWNGLTPDQRDRMRDNERIWSQMTPEQRQHIRQDVLPRWRQLPPDHRQAIQRRLRTLRDMPEDARNRHLNDPDFMRGLTPQEQSMLRDLSHMHVGGAPEPPSAENQF